MGDWKQSAFGILLFNELQIHFLTVPSSQLEFASLDEKGEKNQSDKTSNSNLWRVSATLKVDGGTG